MEKAAEELMEKLGFGLEEYETRLEEIEETHMSKISRAQDKMSLAFREIKNIMEHAKNVEKERLTSL
eukprot:12147336-Karenia_brevis.AAC.1